MAVLKNSARSKTAPVTLLDNINVQNCTLYTRQLQHAVTHRKQQKSQKGDITHHHIA